MAAFPDFSRRASTVMILGAIAGLTTLFRILVRSDIIPGQSLAVMHREFTIIAIVKSDLDLVPIEFAWWWVSAMSWLYIGLSLVLGEDIRDAVRHSPTFFAALSKRFRNFEPRLPHRLLLPLQ